MLRLLQWRCLQIVVSIVFLYESVGTAVCWRALGGSSDGLWPSHAAAFTAFGRCRGRCRGLALRGRLCVVVSSGVPRAAAASAAARALVFCVFSLVASNTDGCPSGPVLEWGIVFRSGHYGLQKEALQCSAPWKDVVVDFCTGALTATVAILPS